MADSARGDAMAALEAGLPDYSLVWARSFLDATEAVAAETFGCLVVDPALAGATPSAVRSLVHQARATTGLVLLLTAPETAEGLTRRYEAQEFLLPAEVATRHLRRSVTSAIQTVHAARGRAVLARGFAAVTAGSTEAMMLIGNDDRVESVCRQTELLTGLSTGELAGVRLSELPWTWVDRDDEPVVVGGLASMLRLASTDAARAGRVGLRTAAGHTTRLFLTVAELPAEGGGVVVMRASTEHLAAEESARFHTTLLNAIGDAVVVTDARGLVTFWNHAAEEIYGWTAAEAVGRPVGEVVRAEDPEHQAQTVARTIADGTAFAGDYTLARRDGSRFPALVSVSPVYDDRHTLVAMIGLSSDITARKRGEESARALSAIVESTADAVISHDLTGTILTWNRGAEDLFGYAAADVVGSQVGDLTTGFADRLAASVAAVARGETVRGLETAGRRKDGTTFELSVTASPVRDHVGAVVAISVIARDISERRRLEHELIHQALHDDLTGLPNRALLDDRLAQTLASSSRDGQPVAVLFLDLDNFKAVNDNHGHLTGDGMLVEVARRLAAVTRPSDTVARFGGDEFVIVCADTSADDAVNLAARIRSALEPPVAVADLRLQTSASVGIAVSPPLEADAESLLRCADAALYEAKASGRARARVFDGSLARQSQERHLLARDLGEALRHDALDVHYEPVVDLSSGRLVALEALVRWRHREHGWVAPALLVALAEQNGLAAALDTWVLERACADAATLRAEGLLPPSARMAVNLSASNVSELATVEAIRRAAAAAELPLDCLELEITETALLSSTSGARDALTALRELGVAVALDGFGAGYSSLTSLLQLPVTTVKIDKSFIHGIIDDTDRRAIATSVIDLGRVLSLRTVAEGVQTSAQRSLLQRLGCDHGQGVLWSEALPLNRLRSLLMGRRHLAPAVTALPDVPLTRAALRPVPAATALPAERPTGT